MKHVIQQIVYYVMMFLLVIFVFVYELGMKVIGRREK